MATVKIVLRDKESKDGTCPLAIRITKDRRSSFIHIGKSLKKDDWDPVERKVKKSYPNHVRLNNFILKKLSDASSISLELETIKSEVSSRAVKQKIKPSGGSTFNTQAQLYLDNLKNSGKYNQFTADKPRVAHFKAFLEGGDIAFSDITISLLERFKVYLKKPNKETKKRLSDRTVTNHLVLIRSVFSQAIKAEIVDRKYYPFGAGKMTIKFPESSKIGLTFEEVKLIEEVELSPGSFEDHARNLWLFSFYFAGMRVSDVLRLKWSDIQNGRLHYKMGKNAKGGSFKISKKAFDILELYENMKQDEYDYIFPDLKKINETHNNFIIQRTIAFTASRIDKILRTIVAPAAKIEKTLTMHIARHTFGQISGDKIPIQMLQKLYRHSSVLTTIGYQSNFLFKDTDEAMESVIGS